MESTEHRIPKFSLNSNCSSFNTSQLLIKFMLLGNVRAPITINSELQNRVLHLIYLDVWFTSIYK